jgi:predicted anti-sigma-YlaC factor YlaD
VSDDIRCTHVIQFLWDYLDAEVTSDMADEIRRHLELCSGWRGLCEFDESFLRAVRRLADSRTHPSSETRH